MEQNKVDQINSLIDVKMVLADHQLNDQDHWIYYEGILKKLDNLINQKENDLLRLSKSGR